MIPYKKIKQFIENNTPQQYKFNIISVIKLF